MAKKRNQQRPETIVKDDGSLRLADSLGENILSKLKQAKAELWEVENQAEVARKEQVIREKREKEANKSFAELLDEYDGKTKKY
ncbi:YqkE family protein [Sporosarcina sp. A2]|uniref:YqkE family protein n=1 Tax=Sporosarcina sp. A2 TaxID=3393449 RepID=UPI003D7A2BFB